MSSDLQGRNAVVFGVANKRSIAWSIAQGLHAAGMKLAITYQNERLEQEAKDLILSLPGAEGYMCDVSKDEEIDRLFATLKERHGKLHALVHSVAYAPADELKGEFINTTREGFRVALDVSVYSLVAVARAAAPLMEDGGSIITMTYYASEKVVPRYNVMAVAKAGSNARCATSPTIWERRIFGSMPSPPDRSKPSPRAASPASAICSKPTPNAPRSAATSTVKKSAPPESFSPPTPAAASPAKSSTWIADITSWDFETRCSTLCTSVSPVLKILAR